MKPVYLTYVKRTPIGRFGGGLSPVRIDDMMALLLKDFKEQCSFDLKEIDDVLVGCANQAGEDNRNIARMSLVLAEFPFEVPGATLNRLCASSLDALVDATCRISTGFNDCILVGGAESMSRAPYVMSKGASPFDRGQQMWDTSIGWRFPNPKMEELFPLYGMGETAEEVATEYKISREAQDEFAFNSHQKAIKAQEAHAFKDEILPVEVKLRKKSYTVEQDEGPRKDTTLEKLATLRAAFRKGGSVTAGNSSSINDGAALVAVVSEEFLKKHNLTPLAQVRGMGIRGCHPNTMGLGPIFATQTLEKKYGIKTSSYDVVELNEAFAAQSLACIQGLNLDPEKVNKNGGAIALGHPLGCSGARITTTLVSQMLKDPKLKLGLATMCIGVGQGVAVAIEKA